MSEDLDATFPASTTATGSALDASSTDGDRGLAARRSSDDYLAEIAHHRRPLGSMKLADVLATLFPDRPRRRR